MGALLGVTLGAGAQVTPVSQMERLDRAPVAMRAKTGGNFLSWRILGTDADGTTFEVLCNGRSVEKGLFRSNYEHASGNVGDSYRIVTRVDGVVVDTTEAVKPWTDSYMQLKLNRPATGANGGEYSPNDCSVGDVDGDGKYELIVKWDPSTSKDNSQGGITDNVFIDCYRLTGEQLWRIDLGRNIRAGAHYTQFMVYDFDGDGKAEMICKTGPGSIDGQGQYVNQAATDATIKAVSGTALYRSSDGRITGGQEWLTAFDGETGAAVHTIFYNPNRNTTYGGAADGSFNWDTRSGKNDKGSYGNRGERYLAGVAYLDGPDKNPSGIFCRGYYTYAFIWAVDFDGQELHQRWLHGSRTTSSYELTTYDAEGNGTKQTFTGLMPTSGSGSGTMFSNGNHNMSIGDVDGDGCDEVIWGSGAVNNDGKLLYGTGFGHGDAIHMSDLDPTRPGLEVFQVHEEKGTYAWDLHDAATGKILFKGGPSGVDNGRGMAAQLDASYYGFYFCSASERQQRSAVTGEVVSTGQTSVNFRIYWDGDVQDELLDGTKIDKWNGNGTSRLYINGKNPYDYNSSSSCNSTKATPNLVADIFGDWREELILWSSADNCTLNIFSTNEPTDYDVPTLMHDHTYRMAICWQNVAYNQPPHLGYYLPDAVKPQLVAMDGSVMEQTVELGDSMQALVFRWKHANLPVIVSYAPDGTRKGLSRPLPGFSVVRDPETRIVTVKGLPSMTGDYRFCYSLSSYDKSYELQDTAVVHVIETTGVRDLARQQWLTMEPQNGGLHLTLDLPQQETATVTVTDGAGRTELVRRIAGNQSCDIQIRKGLHLIQVKSSKGVVTRKVYY